MGKHYVPQAHLRHFGCKKRADHIWVYDKLAGVWLEPGPLPIRVVAQSADFYSPEAESRLAEIEASASQGLANLRRRTPLSVEERNRVTDYMLAAFTRSPRFRESSARICKDYVAEAKRDLPSYLRKIGESKAKARDVDRLLCRYQADFDKDPYRVRHRVLTDTVVADSSYLRSLWRIIFSMGWLVLRSPPGMGFVTGDAIWSFTEGIGFRSTEAEFWFPLSTEACTVGTWNLPERSVHFESGHALQIRGINCFVACSATRFVFFREKNAWIPGIAGRPPNGGWYRQQLEAAGVSGPRVNGFVVCQRCREVLSECECIR